MAMKSSSARKITPPGSILNAPPTPPHTDTKPTDQVAKILQTFRDYKRGTISKSPWRTFKLESQEYDELLDQLKRDEPLRAFVADKVRYDYNPIKSRFVLRMPTILHNTFISKLDREIEKRLHSLADAEPDARAFIKNIESVSGVQELPIFDEDRQRNIRHEPDIMFMHKDAAWPGVVIEVSHSQKKKSLVDLAENYILGTYGGISVVVGLDLDYKKSKQASISIWRLKNSTSDGGEVEGEVVQVVQNQSFRDSQGNPILSPTSSLELALKDFVIQEIADNVPNSSVVIDSEILCKLLGEAEEWDQKTTTMQGVKPRPFKRKWRKQTPPEELGSSDEEKVKEAERRVRRKSERLDTSYGGQQAPAEVSSQGSY